MKKIHIVLCEPEIAGNVGNIIRLSVAFDFQLHLIEPFGFIFSEKWLKRSSTNHFKLASIKIYSDWDHFYQKNKDGYFVLTSSKSKCKLFDFDFRIISEPLYLVFGPESKGLNDILKQNYSNKILKISQTKLVSSINLANAVSVFAFFVLFQYEGLNLD